MTQERLKDETASKDSSDSGRQRDKRDKNNYQTKVVVRRLPPTMTEDQFLDQVSPVPDHNYFYFVKGDLSLGQHAFSRAYINFINQEDIFIFKEKFDGYVFVDTKGNEYPAIVEFAPFQKIPKKRSKKKDAKCGTIDQDPDFIKFVESLQHPDDVNLPSAELYLEEIEAREKELKANNGVLKVTTPLIEYLKQKKVEKLRLREEKREERKRRELEKKRQREEERRRRRAERDKEKPKEKPKEPMSPKDDLKDTTKDGEESASQEEGPAAEPVIVKVLKNPEREKEKEVIKKKETKIHRQPLKPKEYVSDPSVRGIRDRERGRDWDKDQMKQRDKHRINERPKYRERMLTAREMERENRKHKDHRSPRADYGMKKDWYHEKNNEKQESSFDHGCNSSKASGDTNFTLESPTKEETEQIEEAEDAGMINQDIKPSYIDEDVAIQACGRIISSEECEESTNYETKYRKRNTDNNNLDDNKDSMKDPRVERRIRNKDRPSLEIYRPGMRRLNAPRNSPQKDISTSASNSSTPSPSPSPTPQTLSSRKPYGTNDKAKAIRSQKTETKRASYKDVDKGENQHRSGGSLGFKDDKDDAENCEEPEG